MALILHLLIVFCRQKAPDQKQISARSSVRWSSCVNCSKTRFRSSPTRLASRLYTWLTFWRVGEPDKSYSHREQTLLFLLPPSAVIHCSSLNPVLSCIYAYGVGTIIANTLSDNIHLSFSVFVTVASLLNHNTSRQSYIFIARNDPCYPTTESTPVLFISVTSCMCDLVACCVGPLSLINHVAQWPWIYKVLWPTSKSRKLGKTILQN